MPYVGVERDTCIAGPTLFHGARRLWGRMSPRRTATSHTGPRNPVAAAYRGRLGKYLERSSHHRFLTLALSLLRQVDQVARKCENVREGTAGMKYQLSRASEGWIHPSSSVSETSPEWVVYTSIVATSRPFMRAVTAIHPSWLVELAPSLCDMGNPLESPSPR